MEVQEESAALTLTTPSDKHFMALTEQRWTDLKAWMDHAGTENGFQKNRGGYKAAVARAGKVSLHGSPFADMQRRKSASIGFLACI